MPNQGLKSRIAALLTSMLKTSSTESAEPKKCIVGVSGSGSNRAEPIGKYESNGFDSDGSRSRDFNMTFQVIHWLSEHCSPVKTVDFDCTFETYHQ